MLLRKLIAHGSRRESGASAASGERRTLRRLRILSLGILIVLGCLVTSTLTATELPELRIEAPPQMAAIAAKLESFDRQRLLATMELVGLEEPGPPIHITLASEESTAARRAPGWVLGYAFGAAGQIVLMPARVPGYPDRDLESVYLHEITHVLIARAARRRSVPRWFDEGLAMAATRPWDLEDRTRLVFATLRRGNITLAQLSDQFPSSAGAANRAYALSAAYMRDFIDRYGRRAPGEVLDGLGEGLPFAQAFRRVTGVRLGESEDIFWRELVLWNKWIPFLTSSTLLWFVVTGLSLLAFRRRRALDEERRRQWELEDAWDVDPEPTESIH